MPPLTDSRPSSETTAETSTDRQWPIIVLEGMPGAGKTTTARILNRRGSHVLGEYTTPTGRTLPIGDHPAVADDQAHLANFVVKDRQARHLRASGPVHLDRNWLSALAYATSLPTKTRYQLWRERLRWATAALDNGTLTVPSAYVIFHLDPDTSLQRRTSRLTVGHPWSTRPGLERLADFYRDPIDHIGTAAPTLANQLRRVHWCTIQDLSIPATLRRLHELTRHLDAS